METANKEIDGNALCWYVVYTATKTENSVRKLLEKAGVENYLPLQPVARVWNSRRRKLMIPVVPKHLFVHLSTEQMAKVAKIKGVSFLLKEEGEYISVSNQQMAAFRSMVDNAGEYIEFVEEITAGNPVQVVSGELSGVIGDLVEYGGKERLSLRINGLGCALAVAPIDSIEKTK